MTSSIQMKPQAAEDLFMKAVDYMNAKDIPNMKNTLIDLLSKYPNYGRAYNHLGWIYETKYKDYTQAEENYKKGLKLSPEYTPLYINYSAMLSVMEKFSELEDLLQKAMKVPGIDKARIYNEYGIMYELQEKYTDAIEAFRNAAKWTLNANDLDLYTQGIERCEKKKNL